MLPRWCRALACALFGARCPPHTSSAGGVSSVVSFPFDAAAPSVVSVAAPSNHSNSVPLNAAAPPWVPLGAAAASSAPKKKKKTSVVFLLLDDASPDTFSLFPEHSSAAWRVTAPFAAPVTPNVARLVREGTAFRQALAPSLCAPSRVSILTGRYASSTGTFHNKLVMASAAESCAHATLSSRIAKAPGVATAMAGKWGAGPCKQGYPATFEPSDWDEYQLFDSVLKHANAEQCGDKIDFVAGPGKTLLSRYWNPCLVYGGGRRAAHRYLATTADDFGPELEARFALGFVDRRLAQRANATAENASSFFLYWATVLVHETEARTLPSTPRRGPRGDSGLPPSQRLAVASEWTARMRELVSYFDEFAVGALLDVVERHAAVEDVLVWLFSDNSAAYTAKGRGTQRGAEVVSVVWGGGVETRGPVWELTDSTDVFPTLCAVLGCLAPETTEPAHPALDSHDGVSLLPYLLGSAPAPRSWAAAEIGGSRVVLTKACALEAANALLHSAEGRLYLVPSDERCEASVRRPVLDEAIRANCTRANASLNEARAFFSASRGGAHSASSSSSSSSSRVGGVGQQQHHRPFHYAPSVAALEATASGRAFLAYHELEREEHLSSCSSYSRRDESASLAPEYDLARSSKFRRAAAGSRDCAKLADALTDTLASMAIARPHARLCSHKLQGFRLPAASASNKKKEGAVRFLVVTEDSRGDALSRWLAHALSQHANATCVDADALVDDDLGDSVVVTGGKLRHKLLDAFFFGPAARRESVSQLARGAVRTWAAVGKEKLNRLARDKVRLVCLATANPVQERLADGNTTGANYEASLCEALRRVERTLTFRRACDRLAKTTPVSWLDAHDLECRTRPAMDQLAHFLSLPLTASDHWQFPKPDRQARNKLVQQQRGGTKTHGALPNDANYTKWLETLGGAQLLARAQRDTNTCRKGPNVPGYCLDFNTIGRPVEHATPDGPAFGHFRTGPLSQRLPS